MLNLLRVGPLTLDPRSGRVTTPTKKAVHLTPIQTRLLQYLMKHPDVPHPDHRILNQVWGPATPHTARHTVRQHIRFIRLKIEDDPSNPVHLITLIRYGYMVRSLPPPPPVDKV